MSRLNLLHVMYIFSRDVTGVSPTTASHRAGVVCPNTADPISLACVLLLYRVDPGARGRLSQLQEAIMAG